MSSPAGARTLPEMDETPRHVVLARPTIHLPGGLKPGSAYLVDTRSSYVQERIAVGHLVPLEPIPDDAEGQTDRTTEGDPAATA